LLADQENAEAEASDLSSYTEPEIALPDDRRVSQEAGAIQMNL
jgi:hypothetical protein